MNYELAKELKEAGFPQNERTYYWEKCQGHEGELVISTAEWHDGWTNEFGDCHALSETALCAAPTLPELIEACGDYFALWKSSFDGQWHSSFSISGTGYEDTFIDNDYHCPKASGATPEEAVARLYLQLKRASVK